MRSRARIGWAVLLFLAAGWPLLAQGGATPQVGTVVLAVREVRGTPRGGAETPLGVGDGVYLDMTVRTGRASSARMTFDPHGAMELGEEAEVVFDQHTVDQLTGRSQGRLSVLLGRLSLALSRLFQGEVEIATPAANIGVKGTYLWVDVAPDGSTLVLLVEGEATVQSKAGGAPVRVRAGELTVVAPGRQPTPPAAYDPSAGTQTPSSGGPDFDLPDESIFLPDPQGPVDRVPGVP